MHQYRSEYAVKRICRVIEISASGYYKWVNGSIVIRKVKDKILLVKIKEVFAKSYETYGSPKITSKLREKNIRTSKNRVARLMRENNLKSIVKQKFKATTNSNHNLPVAENVLKQNFKTSKPNEVWTSDITYIWTQEGWLYLAIVLDIFTRQIVGWKVGRTLSKELVVEAISKAIKAKRPSESLIFHSDQGVQYASLKVRQLLKQNNFIQSMSNRGNCYDNAITETFFRSLKTEFVFHYNFKTRIEAELVLFKYIELFYNRERIHSSLNYLTPMQYETMYYNYN